MTQGSLYDLQSFVLSLIILKNCQSAWICILFSHSSSSMRERGQKVLFFRDKLRVSHGLWRLWDFILSASWWASLLHSLATGSRHRIWVWVGDGQGGLVCCSPWGCKELDITERLNWLTEWRNRHREQTYGHGERGAEGEMMHGDNNMETYITICKIHNRNSLYVSGNSKRGSVST